MLNLQGIDPGGDLVTFKMFWFSFQNQKKGDKTIAFIKYVTK
jgi:hypothetical protein